MNLVLTSPVEIVAAYLAERDHGSPVEAPGDICEGYKEEARELVKRLGLDAVPVDVMEVAKNQFLAITGVEAAISARDAERGLKEEFQSVWAFGATECDTAAEARECSDGDGGRMAQVRLVSEWRPL